MAQMHAGAAVNVTSMSMAAEWRIDTSVKEERYVHNMKKKKRVATLNAGERTTPSLPYEG